MSEKLRPVLGIICCNRSVGEETAQAVMTRYLVSALPHADAAGLLIPALPDLVKPEEVCPRLDGLLLTGSPSNVDTVHYGVHADEAIGPFDRARDDMTLRLVDVMLDLGKPVFGICRGFQELNVAFGGTLRRDMAAHPSLLPHHAPDGVGFNELFDHTHPVRLTPGGLLRQVYKQDTLDVISVHYQGADRLGDGLKIEATAPDGVIEAVSAEVNGAPVLAVQWHPEWNAGQNLQSQTFFHMLGRALRREPLTS